MGVAGAVKPLTRRASEADEQDAGLGTDRWVRRAADRRGSRVTAWAIAESSASARLGELELGGWASMT